MPGVARKDDTIHGSGDAIHGGDCSSTVFVNGIATALKDSSTHNNDQIVAGSATVFIEGKPVARKDDSLKNGGTIAQGSDDVHVGD